MFVRADDTDAPVDDLVNVYSTQQTDSITDSVDDTELSPSKKRRRHCLAERDINVSEPNDARDDHVTVADSEVTACQSNTATEADGSACTSAPLMSSSTQKHVNKENYAAVTSDSAAAAAAAGAFKSPSHSFKSPPQRRNVFAQNKDSTSTRQRFNLNATKDKPMSPEPIVEVRSRSVFSHAYYLAELTNGVKSSYSRTHLWTLIHL